MTDTIEINLVLVINCFLIIKYVRCLPLNVSVSFDFFMCDVQASIVYCHSWQLKLWHFGSATIVQERFSKETSVQGTVLQIDFSKETVLQGDYCPRMTFVQGHYCPSRLLSKETVTLIIVQGYPDQYFFDPKIFLTKNFFN